ncbi:hypothetical protein PIB30_037766 [Stylosanthes scabra]|uniref:Uncharacterized protein n=1 Tax=Stylosanthes scabra TaxID=79078 RepID=A0ABU6VDD7_9FABA|nr:hypothetical protein [Stylosanthes scabra]
MRLCLDLLPPNSRTAQDHMKRFADKHRREKNFNIVDKWEYEVGKKVLSAVAYKSELPEGSAIHPAFHVSLLKEYKGKPPNTVDIYNLPPSLPFEPMPASIIDSCVLESDEKGRLIRMFSNEDLEAKVVFTEGVIDTSPITEAANTDPTKAAKLGGLSNPIPETRSKRATKQPAWMRDYEK